MGKFRTSTSGGTRPRCSCKSDCWTRQTCRWSGSNRPSNCCVAQKHEISRQLRQSTRREVLRTEPSRRNHYMTSISSSEAAKAIVRRNTEEVQGRGNFDVFEELFA